jgi:hypothetical protein
MVATDTVVGIVGAVALVAVMVGVFVYEYNNEPETADGVTMTDQENRTHFEADWAGLNATDDLDNDGQANYMDSDLDGDGVDNTNDTEEVAYTQDLSGSVGAQGGSAVVTIPVEVATGAHEIVVTITTTGQSGLPHMARLTLVNPDGESQPGETGSGSLTVSAEATEPGTWSVRVEQQQGVPMGGGAGTPFTFTGTAQVHYIVEMADHAHDE